MGQGEEVTPSVGPQHTTSTADELTARRAARKVEVARALRGRTCFVVMPYGQKPVPVDGGAGAAHFETFDFDAVYLQLIRPCLQAEGFDALRSDEESDAGLIHQQMIQRIIDSDLVIVDVSSWNANVFYELGIRHTAQKTGTIIIRRETEKLPFNISGMRVIDYPSFRTAEAWKDGGERAEDARDRLRAAIIASLRPGLPDSPVHTLVPGLSISRPPKPLSFHFGVEFGLDSFIERNLSGSPQSIAGGQPLLPVEAVKRPPRPSAWVSSRATSLASTALTPGSTRRTRVSRWRDRTIARSPRSFARRQRTGETFRRCIEETASRRA